MKLLNTITTIAVALATLAVASPMPDEGGISLDPRANVLEPRKGCSKNRTANDHCGGKKLQKQNSFHNCKNSGGKCCASNANGSGGIDVGSGLGREDCGFCFSGKCKG